MPKSHPWQGRRQLSGDERIVPFSVRRCLEVLAAGIAVILALSGRSIIQSSMLITKR